METFTDHQYDITTANSSTNGSPSESENLHEKVERKITKVRLAKQAEVEVMEDFERSGLQKTSIEITPDTPGGEDEHSPNSDKSDCTVVAAGTSKESVPCDAACTSSNDSSPEECSVRLEVQQEIEEKAPVNPAQVVSVKVRLVRSKAVCDDVSSSPPPPDIHIYQDTSTQVAASCSTLMLSPNIVVKAANRHKLGHDSSQGSSVSESGTSPALSRDSSFDAAYTDSTGTNLEEFIIRTLNKNRNDCAMLLRLENDMISFIRDSKQERHKFPQMSSYHRMLVHRIAAFFGLEHNVDDSGKCVVINKSPNTRVPDFKFREHIWEELSSEDQPKKLILRRHRDCTSLETLGTDRISVDERKSKSFEEREEEYLEARNRIFKQQCTNSDSQDVKTQTPARPDRLCHDECSEVHWLGSDVRPWSSTDSSGYSTDGSYRLKVSVTKASSFHGVTVLTRGDSSSSANSRLSKTDSTSSGISGLSSPVVIPPTIPCSPPNETMPLASTDSSRDYDLKYGSPSGNNTVSSSPFLSFTDDHGEPLAIWVASTIEQIPPGSFIINPQTGKPYTNPDGSLYKWYPPQSTCQDVMIAADDAKFCVGSSQYSLMAQQGQEQLSSCLSGLSVNTAADAENCSPSSTTRFCIQPQPLHVVCQPAMDTDCRQYRYLSPTPAALPTGNSSAPVQLMTLPDMTVQSIETYPVAMQLQCGQIHQQPQQLSNAQSQPYCIELATSEQMTPDVSYKANTSVFYTPVAVQMQLPVQHVRYHLPSPNNTPYQSVIYPKQLPETVENSGATPTSRPALRYVYYSPLSNPSHSTESQQSNAHNVLPVTTCCSSASSPSSKLVHVRSCDQSQFGLSGKETHPRMVAYPHATNLRHFVPGDSRTVQQHHLQLSFHQDMQRLRMPRLPEVNPILYQAAVPAANAGASMISVQQNVITWPVQQMPATYSEGSVSSNVLQVCGLPPGLHFSQLDSYLADLVVVHGARRIDVVQNCSNSEPSAVNLANCTVLAIFHNESSAQKALASNTACGGKFQLQVFPYQHS